QRLRRKVEKSKRILSTQVETRIEIESFFGGHDFSETFTRATFESLNKHLFLSTIPLLEKVLEDSKLQKSDISEILMVGGSTRIPKVQELVKEFFKGTKLSKAIDPDEAVGTYWGAAVHAGILGGEKSTGKLIIQDVNPLTLGIATEVEGIMANMIRRNTIYEGERPFVKDNHLLGQFELTGIPLAPKGVPQLDVTFEIDVNGILNVTAQDRATKNLKYIVITNSHSNVLSSVEIDRMIKDEETFAELDQQFKAHIHAKNEFEVYIRNLKMQLNDEKILGGNRLSKDDKSIIETAVNEEFKWFESNKSNPEIETENWIEHKKQLEAIASRIIRKLYGA
ncbi:unnamed protein product, partial [Didymodactylos carnosus]